MSEVEQAIAPQACSRYRRRIVEQDVKIAALTDELEVTLYREGCCEAIIKQNTQELAQAREALEAIKVLYSKGKTPKEMYLAAENALSMLGTEVQG